MYIEDTDKENRRKFDEGLIGVGHVDSRGKIKTNQIINIDTVNTKFDVSKVNFTKNKITLIKIPKWLSIPVSIILYFYLFLEHNKIFGVFNILAGLYIMYYLSEKSIRFRKRNFFVKFIVMGLISLYMLLFGIGAILSDSVNTTNVEKNSKSIPVEASYDNTYFYSCSLMILELKNLHN
ncbi:hypothetical protein JHL18_13340 [Clostridium sp. YIM B02505]|uniref:Uncharacterized protein n=1 Tax=Clostridium yunnanense TaxID=2800325 RepID=A0ABS1EQQ2_9CLOT|nr:hypothetical protein [Clostridium yunnanense]MBK1811603.1 hypothetical protein [Clostridium yunnanense]